MEVIHLLQEVDPDLMTATISSNSLDLLVPHDTSLEAARVQWSVWRKMSPEQRMRVGFELSAAVRRRLELGVRQRHPDYDQSTVNQAVILLMHGPELFAEIFPGCTVEP